MWQGSMKDQVYKTTVFGNLIPVISYRKITPNQVARLVMSQAIWERFGRPNYVWKNVVNKCNCTYEA